MTTTPQRSEIEHSPREAHLLAELDRLKKELKKTRGIYKRKCIQDEIRSVAKCLARQEW